MSRGSLCCVVVKADLSSKELSKLTPAEAKEKDALQESLDGLQVPPPPVMPLPFPKPIKTFFLIKRMVSPTPLSSTPTLSVHLSAAST